VDVRRVFSKQAFSKQTLLGWPVLRQLTGSDPLGRGSAVQSAHTKAITPRTATADRVVQSVCPYCAVGCGQRVYVKDERVVQIEGDPDSPISRGRLCPKGSASEVLINAPGRATTMLYRRPRSSEWERIGVEQATDMIADRMVASRSRHWQDHDEEGRPIRRTMGFAALGGATLDNEENYLIKKLFTALGAIQIENQARI
jgi:formate dehydrogenase major subunit